MITKNKRLVLIVLGVVTLLLVPFIAMQFSHEVSWSPGDFVVMGGLLLGTGLLCEFVLRKVKKPGYRIALCSALVLVFLLVWMELAVGIFGTPFAGS